MIVRKKFPRGAILAVILAYRSPLPLGKVRTPALPVVFAGARLFQAAVFDGLQSGHGLDLGLAIDSRVSSHYSRYVVLLRH